MDVRYFVVCRSAAGWAVTLEAEHLCDRRTRDEALATARRLMAHMTAAGDPVMLVDLSRNAPAIEAPVH